MEVAEKRFLLEHIANEFATQPSRVKPGNDAILQKLLRAPFAELLILT